MSLFRRLELQQAVFDLATDWVRHYTLPHGLLLPDSIIAASAYFYRLPLLTYNRKDFRYLPEIMLPELDSLLS